jgi:hypothetical protein
MTRIARRSEQAGVARVGVVRRGRPSAAGPAEHDPEPAASRRRQRPQRPPVSSSDRSRGRRPLGPRRPPESNGGPPRRLVHHDGRPPRRDEAASQTTVDLREPMSPPGGSVRTPGSRPHEVVTNPPPAAIRQSLRAPRLSSGDMFRRPPATDRDRRGGGGGRGVETGRGGWGERGATPLIRQRRGGRNAAGAQDGARTSPSSNGRTERRLPRARRLAGGELGDRAQLVPRRAP